MSSESSNPGSSASGDKDEKPEETEPTIEETTQPEDEGVDIHPDEMTYEKYNAMSGEEQLAFFNSFASMEDFVAWYNAAKAKYDAEHPDIEVGDGNIDIGDIVGGGN